MGRFQFHRPCSFLAAMVVTLFCVAAFPRQSKGGQGQSRRDSALQNAETMIAEGRKTFRFDTFGDEAFWGDTLHLHQAIAGGKLGGVGPGVSPRTALSVGLKIDVDALPAGLVSVLKLGQVNLDDPATT